MKHRRTHSRFFPLSFICSMTGHKLHVSREITNHIKEYQCERCGAEMTDTAQGLLEKLTPRFRETNALIAQIHQRRRCRKVLSEAS